MPQIQAAQNAGGFCGDLGLGVAQVMPEQGRHAVNFRLYGEESPVGESAQLTRQFFVEGGVAFGAGAEGKQAVGGGEHGSQRFSKAED
jgi:hypothetical protein